MATNRLNLDFHLETSEDRNNFVNAYLNPNCTDENYINKYNLKNKPFPFPHTPRPEELETIANYILYGKSKSTSTFDLLNKKGEDGAQSVVDAGYVHIATKNSPWQRKQDDSLDDMLEVSGETGNPIEAQYNLISGLNGKTPSARPQYRIPKANFSREECRLALKPTLEDGSLNPTADAFLLEQFENLWITIDILEYTITSYELRTGRRKKEIRDELSDRLTLEQKTKAYDHCTHLNMFSWSKLRKLLVEYRQEQYTLRDSYVTTHVSKPSAHYVEHNANAMFFTTILPCGTINEESEFSKQLFLSTVEDNHFDPPFQQKLIDFLIVQDKELELSGESGVFDFRNLDHIALLIYAYKEMQPDQSISIDGNEYLNHFLNTFNYYVKGAYLEPLHKDIIEMKSNGDRNEDIAAYVNKKYKKTYSANYISTIFRSKCCNNIAAAAEQHWNIVDRLVAGKEEFKQCNTCGKILLKDSSNFVKKTRSSDGLANRCKICDKIARQKKKELK